MKISTTGYKRNSKDKKHKQLYIPGDILTMLGVDDYVQATPQYPDGSLGKTTTMAPGTPRISFPGAVGVIEKKLPKAQLGVPYYANSKYQNLTNRELDALPLAEQDAIYRNEYMTRYNIGANAVDDVLGSSKDVLYSYNGTIPYKTNPDEFLPAGVAFKGEFPAVRVPSGVQYSADHIDWDNYDPYLRDAYFRSVDKVKDWNKQWYTGRATLPQFKDVAEKRLAQLLDIDIQPYGSEEEYLEKFPESGGQFRPFMNDIILPPSSFRNPSLINHELSHLLDYNVPQTPGGFPFPSYNSNDPVLNNIIPDEYKQPYGGLTNILNSIGNGEVIKASDEAGDKESITIPFADKSNVFSNGFLSPGKAPSEYYYKPTEIRARLNEWRFQNKIDPTKNYTEEEIQEIMDNDIKYNQKGSYDLYKLVRGRADLLKKIHDSQVSTGNKKDPYAIPMGKKGGELPKAQYGPPDWRNILDYKNAAPPVKQNLVGDVRKVARPTAVAESTNRNVTHQIPTNTKELKAEADAQAAYDALPEAMKRQDVLTADTRSDTEKFARQAWTAISYPMATISAVNRGHDIPMGSLGMYSPYEGYDVGGPMNFLVDLPAGIPGFIVNAASRQGEQLVDDPLNYAYTMSPLGLLDPETQWQALSNVLDLSAVIPVASAARAAAGPLVKSAGNFLTTQTPLRNVAKYNPWAWKPNVNSFYHRNPDVANIVNQETKMLQSWAQSPAGKAYTEANLSPQGLKFKRGAKTNMSFSKGTPLDGVYSTNKYPGPYLAEVSGETVPFRESVKGIPVSDVPGTFTGSYNVPARPISVAETNFYKEHWFHGYTPIPAPTLFDEMMSTAAPKGNMYGQNQVLTQRARLLDPAVKKKFFANQAPEPEVPASIFAKSPKDLGNRITPENYEDFVNRIHGSTGYELAVAPKTGNNLGIGSYGNQGIVYRDAPLNNLGKDIINAHEKNHGMFAGTLSPEMETALLKPFGTRKPIPNYPNKHQADEVFGRMGQFKNAVGIGDNQTFTLGHLNLIRKNYANQFIDNSIKEMLAKIKPGSAGEREFLINMNKFAFGLTGAGLTGFGIYNAQPLEQPLEQNKKGGQLYRMQTEGQVPDYITPYANKTPVEKPTGAFPSAIQNPDKPDKWYRLSKELTTGDSYDYSNVRRLGEKGKEGYDDYGGALKYDAEARKLYSSFPISNTAYQTSEMSIVSEPSRMGKYYKEFMEAHPNPDDWEDGRDPNSPILEDMLGGLLGIGKTATNPYTGKGWDYYNRRTNHENARTDYIAMKILGENPQGDRNRQDWLASFTPGELALLQKSHKYSGEVAANRWAEGAQGLVNYALTGPGGIMPNPLKEYIPNLFPGQLSDEEAEDTGILNGIGMLAIPAEGIKGMITEGSGRGWAGASPIDYTGGRDKVLDVAGEVFIDPLNLVGVGVLKGLGKIHAGILDDIILKSVQDAGKLNINPTEVFIRNAQREGLIPASANVKTLVDNPNLLNTVVTRGIKNNLTVGRRVTPSAGTGVAESSKGTVTPLAKGDAAALARFTGDPVGEAFQMGTHVPRTAYGQRSGLSDLPKGTDALYFDAPGNFAQQVRATPNQYGDFTVTSRIPFEYSSDPQSMYAKYMQMLQETKGMSGGKGAQPGDIFGKLHGFGAQESAIIGKPGQQVLEPISVSRIPDYSRSMEEFKELNKLLEENPEKFKEVFWKRYNTGEIARTPEELGLAGDPIFASPDLALRRESGATTIDLRNALFADARNKQRALRVAAPIKKTNFSPLTTNFGNSAPVQLTGSQANRRLATAQKQFDVLNKRGYENLTPDELLDAFRLEHEIKNLSTQVNKNTGTTAEAFSDAAETTATVGKEPVDLSKLPNRFNTNGSNADNLDFRRVRLTDKDEPVIIPYIKGTDIPFHRAYRQDMVSYFNSPQFHSIMDTHYPGVDKELYKENILKNLESPLVYNPNFVSETAAGNYHRHTSRSDLGRNVFSLGAPKLQTKVKYANTYHSAPELERFGEKAGNSYVNSEYAVKHEYRHQATNSDELLPESLTKEDLLNNLTPEGKVLMEKEIAENKKYRVDNYYSNPTEFDVRIRRLKDDLKENGIVDYFNEPVTQEHIAQLLEQQKAYDEYEKIGTEKLWQEFTAGRREIKNNPNLTEAQKKEATDLLKEKYEKDQDLMDASKPVAPKINKDTKDLLRYWSTEFLANKAGILPAAIPVGIGIGVATQEKKKGGSVNKRNHKDLDNYFAQAWSKSRKTA